MGGKIILNIFEKNIKIFKKNNFLIVHINNVTNTFQLACTTGNEIWYDSKSQHLIFNSVDIKLYANLISALINNILFNFKRLWHIKIKFTGKGFKIKRKKKKKIYKILFLLLACKCDNS